MDTKIPSDLLLVSDEEIAVIKDLIKHTTRHNEEWQTFISWVRIIDRNHNVHDCTGADDLYWIATQPYKMKTILKELEGLREWYKRTHGLN